MQLNQVVVMGNLTADPEIKEIGDSQVANFAIACNVKYKNSEGEQQERPDFFDVEVWGKGADVVRRYLSKGKPVIVTGRLRQDRWETEDGNNRSKVKIRGNVQLLPRSTESRQDEGGNDDELDI